MQHVEDLLIVCVHSHEHCIYPNQSTLLLTRRWIVLQKTNQLDLKPWIRDLTDILGKHSVLQFCKAALTL